MAVRAVVQRMLEHPIVYRLWQAPFETEKLRPVLQHNDLASVQTVLDVGCGPGTNAGVFRHADYLGFDINPRYVEYARRRHRGRFVVADVTSWQPRSSDRFEFVMVNSLLHHIDDDGVSRALASLREAVTEGGHLHLLELVTPTRDGLARWLASADRGQFSRSVAQWVALCQPFFDPVIVHPYALTASGITLWNMLYLKGRPRS
jgi:SAM-dependent methyltransferase